jgi:hypothetical protein
MAETAMPPLLRSVVPVVRQSHREDQDSDARRNEKVKEQITPLLNIILGDTKAHGVAAEVGDVSVPE